MSGKQNPGEIWDADTMIRNAKALQRVVKELEKNKPKPSLSNGWGKWNRGTQDRLLFMGRLLAVPNLLSLATEIALKAWLCWERQKAPERTHDLLELFPEPGTEHARDAGSKDAESESTLGVGRTH